MCMRHIRIDSKEAPRFNPKVEDGLLSTQVELRKEQGLVNQTSLVVGKSTWEIIRTNVLSFFNILLFFLAGLLIYGNVNDSSPDTRWYSGLFFVFVLLLNIGIGLYQDIKAKHLMKKMKLITSQKTTVIRNGKEEVIDPQDIVLDDLMLLKSGEQITADAYIVEGEITVNESLLTGESLDVSKKVGDLILSGTYVSGGRCYAKVERVGKDNYVETLSSKAKAFKRNPSHILKSLKALFRTIGIFVIFLLITIITTYALLGAFNSKQSFVNTIAPLVGQFVAMIPAGLYLLTSFTLATGVLSLHKRHANVQDLYSIEMLARADVLCVDKTGTITDGTMKVIETVSLIDKEPQEIGDIIANIVNATKDDNFTAKALKEHYSAITTLEVSKVLPFTSKNKYSGVSFVSGATYLLGAAEYLNHQDDKLVEKINEYTSLGLRVLLLAKGNSQIKEESYNDKVTPIALIVLQDHVKENAIETFSWFNSNNVNVKVISGDNAITVSEIAKVAGIIDADKYVSLEGKSIEEVKSIATQYNVFGRVTPEQKEALVIALKEAGQVVAMTGDGVNDMLALKRADCSIAMNSGAQAAKNVSHVVLMNDDFSTMPEIVAEGRRVINNLERTGSLFLTKTIFAIFFSITFWIVSIITSNKYAYPFSPNNLMVWENFGIGLSAFFISLERNPKPITKGFLRNIFVNAIPNALTIIIAVIFCYVAFLLQNKGVMYTGVYSFGFDTEFSRLPRYGATALAVILFSGLSLVVLYNTCRPMNKYRALVVAGASTLAILSFLLSGLLNNTSLFGVDFSKVTNPNIIFIFANLIVLSIFIITAKPAIIYLLNKIKLGRKKHEN